jgi:hypothetical protein
LAEDLPEAWALVSVEGLAAAIELGIELVGHQDMGILLILLPAFHIMELLMFLR